MEKRNSRRGQLDIIALIIGVVLLVMFAPFLMRMISVPLDKFSSAINQTSPVAAAAVTSVRNTGVTWMDWIIVAFFFSDMIAMFVFSYFVNTNKFFVIGYIASALLTIAFSPYMMAGVSEVFNMPEFQTEVLQLPMTNFIVTNFSILLLGIIIVNGVILYVKLSSPQDVYR